MANDFLSEFLEENPDILFQAMRPQRRGPGRGSSFIDYWRGQQGNVWQDYLGSMGQSVLGGNIPTQSFQGFLRDLPWTQRWEEMSPRGRGEYPSLFAPRTRWNI